MNPIDIAVIVLVSVAVLVISGYLIYKKIKGKGGCCGCDCSACIGCTSNCKHDKK